MVRFEPLGGGVSAVVDAYCRVSQDGMLLASFASPAPHETALDLGTGNGLIPLCWCRRDPPARIVAVEREEAFASLARKAIETFPAAARIDLRVEDWNDTQGIKADVITCNPPYFRFGASRVSDDPLNRVIRHEESPDVLDKLCATAERLLADGGRFCLCHRPERLADVMTALREAGLTARRLQYVKATEAAKPWLFLCEAGRDGTLTELAPAVMYERGTHTAVYKRLYR